MTSRRLTIHPFQTKQGKHGTLYRFRITYRDKDDFASPEFDWYTWAYDPGHAEDRFYESDGDEGWKIISVEKTRDTSRLKGHMNRTSRRDVVKESRRLRSVERYMIQGFLEAVWLDSYMSWAEEHGHGHRTGHIPQHVKGLSDIPQAPPLAAKKFAKKFAAILVKINRATLTELYKRASRADGHEVDPVALGFYLAMQSAGHGVSWTDSHATFKVLLPSAEWHAYGPKGRVRVDAIVSERHSHGL